MVICHGFLVSSRVGGGWWDTSQTEVSMGSTLLINCKGPITDTGIVLFI